jgi:hypothetical protein
MIIFVFLGILIAASFFILGFARGKKIGDREATIRYGQYPSVLPRVINGVIEPFDYQHQSKRFPSTLDQTRTLIWDIERELRRFRRRSFVLSLPLLVSFPLYVFPFFLVPSLGPYPLPICWGVAGILGACTLFLRRFNYQPRYAPFHSLRADLPLLYFHDAVLAKAVGKPPLASTLRNCDFPRDARPVIKSS